MKLEMKVGISLTWDEKIIVLKYISLTLYLILNKEFFFTVQSDSSFQGSLRIPIACFSCFQLNNFLFKAKGAVFSIWFSYLYIKFIK